MLRAEPLASGVYEIRRARRTPRKATVPPPGESVPEAEKKEEDLGYGESHGYGPAHGGPTGPGDAPA
jgi:hypothetical protein